jgi:GNAT superfamily N-acetyltransferase
MELSIRKVIPTEKSVKHLIQKLDTYQIGLYGIEQCNLESPESLHKQECYMLGAFGGTDLIGIGGVKLFETYGEIKRMYVDDSYRGRGIAEAQRR